jgi:hypothetical protein
MIVDQTPPDLDGLRFVVTVSNCELARTRFNVPTAFETIQERADRTEAEILRALAAVAECQGSR